MQIPIDISYHDQIEMSTDFDECKPFCSVIRSDMEYCGLDMYSAEFTYSYLEG